MLTLFMVNRSRGKKKRVVFYTWSRYSGRMNHFFLVNDYLVIISELSFTLTK